MDDDHIKTTSIEGLVIVDRPTFSDPRGFFKETFRLGDLEKRINREFKVLQENHSRSVKNTLRGIHTAPWNKLIYVARGEIQAVIVDFRPGSPTFGKHESIILGENNRAKVFVPAGCGNAYLVLSDEADYTYLTDQYWEPGKEFEVLWSDPGLGIDWKLPDGEEPIVSERDQQAPTLKDKFPDQVLA